MNTYTITYRADSIKLIYPHNYPRLIGAVRAKYTKEYKRVSDTGIMNNLQILNDIDNREAEAIRKRMIEITHSIVYQGEEITDRIVIETFYTLAKFSFGDCINNAREAMEMAVRL